MRATHHDRRLAIDKCADIIEKYEITIQDECKSIQGTYQLSNIADELATSSNNTQKHKTGYSPINMTTTKSAGAGNFLQYKSSLNGHFDKVFAISCCPTDESIMVSVGRDSSVIYWDIRNACKFAYATLDNAWTISCAVGLDGKKSAIGGLDDHVTVYDAQEMEKQLGGDKYMSKYSNVEMKDFSAANDAGALALSLSPQLKLSGHEGYVSDLYWLSDREIISSSGDKNCILWDLEKRKAVSTFKGHYGDVLCVDGFLKNGHRSSINASVFVSGSTDQSARVWDVRTGKCEKICFPQCGDINDIATLHNGYSFGIACEYTTGSANVMDMRLCVPINSIGSGNHGLDFMTGALRARGSSSSSMPQQPGKSGRNINSAAGAGAGQSYAGRGEGTKIAFSSSGAVTFVGYSGGSLYAHDTVSAEVLDKVDMGGYVSGVAMNASGNGLCVSTWNKVIKVFG